MSSSNILTADIGGSHITAAICNIANNQILADSITRVELFSKGRANDILGCWVNAFTQVVEKKLAPISALSVAMPGPFDYENGISYIKGLSKYDALYGINIKQHLSQSLKIDSELIRFRNDAEATIAGEAMAGAGVGFKKILGVTLGTGFGAAYFCNGITTDLDLGARHFKSSIADEYLSTRWFLKRYFEITGVSVTSVKELTLLADDNSLIKSIFKEFAINMADFLEEAIEQYKPEVLIVSGNIAKASKLFLPQLKVKLNGLPIVFSQLGEQAALIGAATLFTPAVNLNLSQHTIN